MGTDIDYNTVSHQTIYQHLTGGAGSVDLTEASQGWQGVAARLEQLRGDVEQAIRGIGASQQGASADAATQATMALLPWLQGSVGAAKGISERISQQAGSFGHTRDNMPPPVSVPEVSFSQDPASWMGEHAVEWLPGIQTGHEQAQVEAQQAQQRARELMNAYQSTSNDNLAVPQQFAAAPTVVADIADPSLGAGGIGSSGGGVGVGAAHPGSAHPAVTHAAGTPAAGHQASGAPAATTPQLAPATHPEPAATTPQLAGGDHPGAGTPSLTGSGQVRPAPFGPSPILAAPTSGGGHLAGGGSRGLAGAAGTSRAGGFGPRPTPTFSDGHSQSGSAAHTAAAHTAAAHTAAEHLGADRSTRGAGFSGAPPGATGGAGRGENTEHRRPSYLLEQDSNALIGELPRVAPPVIGAD